MITIVKNLKTTYQCRPKHTLTLEAEAQTDKQGGQVNYNWMKDGVLLGITNGNYPIADWDDTKQGVYQCAFSDGDSTVYSTKTIITTDKSDPIITITQQAPDGFIVEEDKPFAFSITASTSDAQQPLSYEWTYNSKSKGVSTVNGNTSVSHASKAHDGLWRCRIKSGNAVLVSPPVKVQVDPVPFIRFIDPTAASTENTPNLTDFLLDVEVLSNINILSYQWQEELNSKWTDIKGATEPSYLTPVLQSAVSAQTHKYKCIVSGGGITKTSEVMSVQVSNIGIKISVYKNPDPLTNVRAGSTDFMICHADTDTERYALSYDWFKNDQPVLHHEDVIQYVDDNGDFVIEFVNVQPDKAGLYKCRVKSGPVGHEAIVFSPEAALTVDASKATLAITEHPKSGDHITGVPKAIHCIAETNDPKGVRYEWMKDGIPLEHETKSILSFHSPSDKDNGVYTCTVNAGEKTWVADTLVSSPANLTFSSEKKSHIKYDVNLDAAKSLTVGQVYEMFVVVTTDGWPLKYQWFKDNKPILGETKDYLVFDPVKGDEVGDYNVVAYSGNESVLSTQCVVTVNDAKHVNITTQPKNRVINTTFPIRLTCKGEPTVTGAVVTYQWYKDGVVIPQTATVITTTDTLQIPFGEVVYGAGLYTCLVTSSNTSKFTKPAWLFISDASQAESKYVHPLPHRETSFMYVGYWVIDEIKRQVSLGHDWIQSYNDTKYPRDIETIVYALKTYGESLCLESRNGRIQIATLLPNMLTQRPY